MGASQPVSFLRRIARGIAGLFSSFLDFIRRDDADVREIASILEDMRRETWEDTMIGAAARFGGPPIPFELSPESERWIKKQSLADARSIVETANRDAERFLRKLAETQKDATPAELSAAYAAWIKQRASWKVQQIVQQTEYTTQGMARQRFWERNNLTGGKFRFIGPPPVCEDCVRLMMMGDVSWSVVQANPAPRHVNCTHQWELVKIPERPQSLWIG